MSDDRTGPPGGAVTLANDVTVPRLGLGVFRSGAGERTRDAVLHALRCGYRHIDTAAIYGNEVEVGEAVRRWLDETGHARHEVFVTTKLWNADHGFDQALRAFDASERALGAGGIDLYLVHWPVPGTRAETWRALERLYGEGRCRAIGVSNFTADHLAELLETAAIVPHMNQIELHPFLAQQDLVARCRRLGVQTAAYSPLTKGRLLDDPTVAEIATDLGASPAQVLIRWGLAQGHVVLPKSSNLQRIEENLAAAALTLSPAHQLMLATLDSGVRVSWDPTTVE